jgi:hypothetical protein
VISLFKRVRGLGIKLITSHYAANQILGIKIVILSRWLLWCKEHQADTQTNRQTIHPCDSARLRSPRARHSNRTCLSSHRERRRYLNRCRRVRFRDPGDRKPDGTGPSCSFPK